MDHEENGWPVEFLYIVVGISCIALMGWWSNLNRKASSLTEVPQSPMSLNKKQYPVGKLNLIMGPMFAGKTRELLRRLDYHRVSSKIQDVRCLLIKSKKDNRYDPKSVVCHNHDLKDSNCLVVDCLEQIKNQDIAHVQHIFVDEGQFFPDLVRMALAWIESGRHVTVAALDAYASQEMWPNVACLIPWCNNLVKLHAVCGVCGDSAPLSVKYTHKDEKNLEVGGKELYRASCVGCRKI